MDSSFPCKWYGKSNGLCLLVIVNSLHFSVLNFILEWVLHLYSLVRSSCNDWQSHNDVTALYSLESSACSAGLVLCETRSGRSFIHTRKSNGLGMLPWGTPDVTEDNVEATPSITTRAAICHSNNSRINVEASRLYHVIVVCVEECLKAQTLSRSQGIIYPLACYDRDFYLSHVVHQEGESHINDSVRNYVKHY